MNRFVHALYPNQAAADAAVNVLMEAHVAPDEVRVLVREGEQVRRRRVGYDMRVGKGALAGAAIGVAVGAIMGAIGWPDLLAAAPTGGTLQGAVFGTLFGLFVGAIRGRGWWDRTAEVSPAEDDSGIMIGVSTSPERAGDICAALVEAGGHEVVVTDRSPMSAAQAELGRGGVTGAPPGCCA